MYRDVLCAGIQLGSSVQEVTAQFFAEINGKECQCTEHPPSSSYAHKRSMTRTDAQYFHDGIQYNTMQLTRRSYIVNTAGGFVNLLKHTCMKRVRMCIVLVVSLIFSLTI